MKNIFLIISVLYSFILNAQIPNLAERTFKGKLTSDDFVIQKSYLVNLDTSETDLTDLVSRYLYYVDKKDVMVSKMNETFENFKVEKIENFVELKDNLVYYPSKLHWYCLIGTSRIDWWFTPGDEPKLQTITLTKIKKGT